MGLGLGSVYVAGLPACFAKGEVITFNLYPKGPKDLIIRYSCLG